MGDTAARLSRPRTRDEDTPSCILAGRRVGIEVASNGRFQLRSVFKLPFSEGSFGG